MAGGPLATRIGNGDHWAAPANRYVGSDGQALVAVADTDARFEAMMETLELGAAAA